MENGQVLPARLEPNMLFSSLQKIWNINKLLQTDRGAAGGGPAERAPLAAAGEPRAEPRTAARQELQQGAAAAGELQGGEGEAVPVQDKLPGLLQNCLPSRLQVLAISTYSCFCDALLRNPSPERPEPVSVVKQEMSFRIKKCLGSRKGWKIIPDDDEVGGELNSGALRTVVNMIKEMECQVSGQDCFWSFTNTICIAGICGARENLSESLKSNIYKQNFIYSQSTINAIYMLDKIDYPLCFVIAHISAIHIILTPRSHPSYNF